jgi:peptidoglycan biosynthesis protein MviN/MurJ (putative lipid II flippase)
LALGTSITAIINASIQLFLLRRELHGIDGSRIAASFLKVMVASAVMGAVTWSVHEVMIGMLPGASLVLQMVRLLVTITLSLATLAAVAQVLRIQEFGEARDLILGRLKRMVG